MNFALKVIISALIIATASELSKKYNLMAALLVALPLTSIQVLIWSYYEHKNVDKIIEMSNSILYLTFPSLMFFILFSGLLKFGINFIPAISISTIGMIIFYWACVMAIKLFS
jgi:hypothetical protein